MKKLCYAWAAIIFIAALATACGGSSGNSYTKDTAASSAAASENSPTEVAGPTITIADMAFGQPLTVAPGTQITVANNDSPEHSVTSDTAGAFDVEVDGHEKKTLTAPTQPGEYPFHCKYHPNMKGTLIVK